MKNQKIAGVQGTNFPKPPGLLPGSIRWTLLVIALLLCFLPFARVVAGTPFSATTLPATAITSSGATLNGSINPSNSPTGWYFVYGTSTNYGSYGASFSMPATNIPVSVGATVTGLASNTLYHFMLVAQGDLFYTNANGGDLTFSTALTTPVANPQAVGWVLNNPTTNALSGAVLSGVTNFSITQYPADGQVILLPGFATNGLWTYQPFTTNFFGSDNFLFEVSDTNGDVSAPALVTITVTNIPCAFSQSVSFLRGNTPVFQLTGIVASGLTNFNVVKNPTNGALTELAGFLTNGLFQYNPTGTTSNSGPDNFTFNVSDGLGNTSPVATVTILMTNVPYAFNQSIGWFRSTFPTNQLAGLVASGPTNFVLVRNPVYGQVIPLAGFNTNGLWTYQPYASNFFGADSFAFTVHDKNGNNSAAGMVNLTVTNVPAAPFAQYQYLKTRPNQPLTIYLSGDDDGNDPRFPTNNTTPLYAHTRAMQDWNPTFTLLSFPTNGILTGPVTNLTYTPTNANVFDSLTFRVNNGYLDSATATVMIKIAPYNIGTNYFDANFSQTPGNTNHWSDVPLVNVGTVRPGFENGAFTLTNGVVEQDSFDPSNTPTPGSSRTDDGMILITNLLDRLGRPRLFNFYGKVYTNFWVDNNGLISFTAGISNYVTQVFPASPTLGPFLAPLWCDVDTRATNRGGVVTYGQGYVTDQGFLGEPPAPGRPALIITWNYVASYNENTNKLNRYQAVMIDRSDLGAGVFDFEANYEYVEWLSGAASGGSDPVAGFDLGDGTHYFNFVGSLTPAVTNLPSESNLVPSFPGRTLYRLSAVNAPTIASFTVTNIGTTSALLSALVSPYGPRTTVFFSLTNQTLGTTVSLTATNLPSDCVTPVPVALNVENLQSGSTYTATMSESVIDGSATTNPVTFGTVPRLSSLSLNSGSLVPAFSPDITGYLVQVSNTPSITLSNLVETPTTHPVLYQINGGGYTTSSGPFTLQAGANPVNVQVVSTFGVTNVYTVNVMFSPSTDSSLAALTLSPGSFSPGFSSSTLNYSATVDPVVTNLLISAWTTSPYATIQINGGASATYTNSAAISPGFGPNLIPVTVTAQDGVTTTTYLLDVTRTSAAPVVTLLPAGQITKTNAVLNATVNPQGTNAAVYFQYGLDTNYGSLAFTPPVPTAFVDEPVNATVNGLSPGTTYHYRAVASSVFGSTTSGDMEFITIGVPVSLAIAQSPTWPNPANVLLTWPTNAIGAQLQSSALQLPPNWQPVTNPVNAISGTNTVCLPASTNAQFFRLNYP